MCRYQNLLPLVAALMLSITPASAATPYFPPADGWETRSPADVGLDASALEAATAFAGEHHSTGLTVVRYGYLVLEHYWQDWDAQTSEPIYSSTKSMVATLVGAAIDDGYIRSVDQPAADFVSGWKNSSKQAITLRHLLSMTSGLSGYSDQTILVPRGIDAQQAMAKAELENPPGSRWRYHTPAYRMLARILEEAVGETLSDYQNRRLFHPIGMRHTRWDTLPTPDGGSNYLFMRSSLRDMSRFGLLILRQGRWGTTELVNGEFIAESTRRSQALNPSYGYLWWLGGETGYQRPAGGGLMPGPMWPDCPPDAAGALGAGDKKIYVIPSLDLVVTRHGSRAYVDGDPGASSFDNELLGRICRAVTDD